MKLSRPSSGSVWLPSAWARDSREKAMLPCVACRANPRVHPSAACTSCTTQRRRRRRRRHSRAGAPQDTGLPARRPPSAARAGAPRGAAVGVPDAQVRLKHKAPGEADTGSSGKPGQHRARPAWWMCDQSISSAGSGSHSIRSVCSRDCPPVHRRKRAAAHLQPLRRHRHRLEAALVANLDLHGGLPPLKGARPQVVRARCAAPRKLTLAGRARRTPPDTLVSSAWRSGVTQSADARLPARQGAVRCVHFPLAAQVHL